MPQSVLKTNFMLVIGSGDTLRGFEQGIPFCEPMVVATMRTLW